MLQARASAAQAEADEEACATQAADTNSMSLSKRACGQKPIASPPTGSPSCGKPGHCESNARSRDQRPDRLILGRHRHVLNHGARDVFSQPRCIASLRFRSRRSFLHRPVDHVMAGPPISHMPTHFRTTASRPQVGRAVIQAVIHSVTRSVMHVITLHPIDAAAVRSVRGRRRSTHEWPDGGRDTQPVMSGRRLRDRARFSAKRSQHELHGRTSGGNGNGGHQHRPRCHQCAKFGLTLRQLLEHVVGKRVTA
jgi:hypothetical protein